MNKTIKLIKEKIYEKDSFSNSRLLIGILLGLFIIIYNFIWLNKSFTMSECWAEYYNGLLSQGMVPYKDFYYFLPPLNLLIDFIIWKLSFGYIFIYRLWRLAERIFIIELLYTFISKRIRPWIAGISGMVSCMLLSANVYDLCGDYNQSQQLLIVLSAIFLAKYADNLNKQSRYKYVFLVGVCGGMMFLVKQPVVVAAVISYTLLLIVFVCFKLEHNIIKILLFVVSGAVLTLIPPAVYMLITGSIQNFIYQVFLDVSSKGSLYIILIQKLFNVFLSYIHEIVAFTMLLVARSINKNNSYELRGRPRNGALGYIAISIIVLIVKYSQLLLDTISTTTQTVVGLIFTAQVLILTVGLLCNISLIMCFSFVVIITFMVLTCNINEVAYIVHEKLNLFSSMTQLMTALFCCIIVWLIYHLGKHYKSNTPLDGTALSLSFASIVSGYACIMANGETAVSTITAFLIIPTFTYIMFRSYSFEHIARAHILCIHIFTIIILTICLSQKLVCSYAWWGDTEASFFEKTETSNIQMLKGFKFSEEEIKRYDRLNEVISVNATADSVIWGFPYTKIYNLFQDNYNMNGFVPVEFYDTCADDYAEQEVALLSNNPPDIVVWQDIPGCIETHEEVYRDGTELGQRKIVDWFSSVREDKYTLIGQVESVFVYKLNDETEISKTYIQSKYAVNETATKNLNLKGSGCKSIPFEISSFEDLNYLRTYVNNGNDLKGVYFKQTADIQFEEGINWSPIGDDESDGFAGIYDGNGYTINNLYMLSDHDEDLALFGKLDGTVINLSVEGAWIGGQNIAFIANTGSGNIINCYASGILYGYNCSGISHEVEGNIQNNVALITVEKGNGNGIVGSFSEKLENNYSNFIDVSLYDSGELISDSSVEILNRYVDKYNGESNDYTLLRWHDVNGTPRLLKE